MDIKKFVLKWLMRTKKRKALKAWKEFVKHKRLPLP